MHFAVVAPVADGLDRGVCGTHHALPQILEAVNRSGGAQVRILVFRRRVQVRQEGKPSLPQDSKAMELMKDGDTVLVDLLTTVYSGREPIPPRFTDKDQPSAI